MKNNDFFQSYKHSLKDDSSQMSFYDKYRKTARKRMKKNIPSTHRLWWFSLSENQKEQVFNRYIEDIGVFKWNKIMDEIKPDVGVYRKNKIKSFL